MKYYGAIFITIALFSTIEVVTKLIGGGIDPIFLSFLRFFVSGLIIGAINFFKIKELRKKDALVMGLLGIAGVTLALGAFHVSLQELEAAKGAVIFSINPVFAALFAYFFYKERLSGFKIAGIAGGFAGVYILNFGLSAVEIDSIRGPLLMLFAAFGFSLYIVGAKKYVKRYGGFFTTGYIFTVGALGYIPFIKSWHITNLGEKIVPIAYLVIFATGIAYLFYFYGLKHVSLAAGTSVFYAKPVLASLLSVAVLGEHLNSDFYIGLVIIMISLTLSLFGEKWIKYIIRRRYCD